MLLDEAIHDCSDFTGRPERNLSGPASAGPARDRARGLAEQAGGLRRLDVASGGEQVVETFVGGIECVGDELKVRASALLPRCP